MARGRRGGGGSPGGRGGGSRAGGGRPAGRGAGGASRAGQRERKPVSGPVSSPYGRERKDPKTGKTRPHRGADFKVKVNTPVRATGGGKVVRAGWENPKNDKQGFGQRVTIDHGRGNTSIYGHLNSTSVKVGDRVKPGQVIGRSGNTGRSTGPHLHYEERYKNRPHRPTFNPGRYRPRK